MSEVSVQPFQTSPLSFRFVKFLSRHRIRGSARLEGILRRRGAFDRPLAIALSPEVKLETPIRRPDNFWDEKDVLNYDAALFESLRSLLRTLPAPALLIDGGADIGLYSARLVAENPSVRLVRAFEPNRESYVWLERNLSRLPADTMAIGAALGEFEGKGELAAPAYDASDHARYLAPSDHGAIPVMTIDGANLPAAPTLIIKLDLEGGELAALRGAAATIRKASHVVVILEAHRLVSARTKRDPNEMLVWLESLRPFSFHIRTDSGPPIDPGIGFYEQFPDAPKNLNIVGVSL